MDCKACSSSVTLPDNDVTELSTSVLTRLLTASLVLLLSAQGTDHTFQGSHRVKMLSNFLKQVSVNSEILLAPGGRTLREEEDELPTSHHLHDR